MKYLMYIMIVAIVIFILLQIGDAWINYNMDRNAWIRARDIILYDNVTPNYIEDGRIFKMNGHLFIKANDDIYLLKKY